MTDAKGQMMAKRDSEYERLLAEEALILDATELVSELMAAKGLTRADLAKRIGKTRGFVTQVLSGNRNMTLRTLADLSHALDARVNVFTQPLESLYGQSTVSQFSMGLGFGQPFATFTGTDAIMAGISALSASWLVTKPQLGSFYSDLEAASTFLQANAFTHSEPAVAKGHIGSIRRPRLRLVQGRAA